MFVHMIDWSVILRLDGYAINFLAIRTIMCWCKAFTTNVRSLWLDVSKLLAIGSVVDGWRHRGNLCTIDSFCRLKLWHYNRGTIGESIVVRNSIRFSAWLMIEEGHDLATNLSSFIVFSSLLELVFICFIYIYGCDNGSQHGQLTCS